MTRKPPEKPGPRSKVIFIQQLLNGWYVVAKQQIIASRLDGPHNCLLDSEKTFTKFVSPNNRKMALTKAHRSPPPLEEPSPNLTI